MNHQGVTCTVDGHEGVLLTVPSEDIKTFVPSWALEPPTRPEHALPSLHDLWPRAEQALHAMRPGEPMPPFAVNGFDGIMVSGGHDVDFTVWLPLWVLDPGCPYRLRYNPARRQGPGYEGDYVPEGKQFDPSQSYGWNARAGARTNTQPDDDGCRHREARRRNRERRRHRQPHQNDDRDQAFFEGLEAAFGHNVFSHPFFSEACVDGSFNHQSEEESDKRSGEPIDDEFELPEDDRRGPFKWFRRKMSDRSQQSPRSRSRRGNAV